MRSTQVPALFFYAEAARNPALHFQLTGTYALLGCLNYRCLASLPLHKGRAMRIWRVYVVLVGAFTLTCLFLTQYRVSFAESVDSDATAEIDRLLATETL